MKSRKCTPLEFPSLLIFCDYDLVVRCIELIRLHVPEFAPSCTGWQTEVITLCHHHPQNIYPALGVFAAGGSDLNAIEHFGQLADAWVKEQKLGWLLQATTTMQAKSWDDLRKLGTDQNS